MKSYICIIMQFLTVLKVAKSIKKVKLLLYINLMKYNIGKDIYYSTLCVSFMAYTQKITYTIAQNNLKLHSVK
ncbi:hypothetical protein TOT_030000516 [Theileria orientalis strain Shintoku]|uniref:Uncharacterized protein n=1 Tax=Theileria orientalis strain Shintoku TaxID=869250 RepID=J4C8R6_THEOR|nr:hypothetical protein TOT_030000516 [Theileria orientalis strain Shintoku]BAM41253.1 hypothetical protein TOT_030000516 [Theileria orientalis strain Shintoku]|eukprot:XP_009691554.1 hypothetical protein TOT_030000516 [Theileria orientalis strain Shintoku]